MKNVKWILFSFLIAGMIYWWWPPSKTVDENVFPDGGEELSEEGEQEAMGEVISPQEKAPATVGPTAESYSQIVSDMASCLTLTSEIPAENSRLTKEALVSLLQKDFGQSTQTDERFQEWNVINDNGVKQKYRLEVVESDEGQALHELFAYSLDADGMPEPIDLDPDVMTNPTAEQMNQLLQGKNIESHEIAGSYLFPRSERLEYLERNGVLSEFELIRGDMSFRCKSVESEDSSCQCNK